MRNITKTCTGCGGTGAHSGMTPSNGESESYDNICQKCDGSGTMFLGELSNDLIDLLNDMNDKINDIFEKVNE